MRWKVKGEREVLHTPWLGVWCLDVERPDGTAGEYHVVRLRDLAVVAAVDDRRVLMMWRHRIATDTWAWEFPMGLVEDDEDPPRAAARELEEETGWRPGALAPLLYAEPAAGVTNARHFLFRADACELVGPPTEKNESDRIEWIPLARIPEMIRNREIVSSATLVGAMALLLE
ncbi:NUDIX hydrolase [Parafrankia sp. EAN1pec]|uniref:NUDIX hydrolase n=1 Tax=Parafrankia sp. (strain EAN1pec) TaxID=298653 RepID=UPI00005423D6|nr:NUDIX hydrolase [Frankia sp. EAN1pec]